MISVTDLRNGAMFEEDGHLWQVLKYEHIKMGRGSATIKVKVRDVRSGSQTDRSFISGARVQEATLEKRKAQFLYADDKHAVFMDASTFEQFQIPRSTLGATVKLFRDGMDVTVAMVKEEAVGIELPPTLPLRVASADPGVKGDSVSNMVKSATLENGLNVSVPLFVKEGDIVKLDTRTFTYAGRLSDKGPKVPSGVEG
ncbi:MAG: elongation factor P [bacterium]|nr:elongation factor P [bacterium]